ncbi:phosphatidate cytidylyltransferase [Demequina pelophila]|uniref:phosphatidate cytidylyltransferase n=1 Tax=Demequina pelophila TaxID=1638984 RepID=UPI00078163AF|nr:phosphatidate cytidylyltransferase [Demequina pelophila]
MRWGRRRAAENHTSTEAPVGGSPFAPVNPAPAQADPAGASSPGPVPAGLEPGEDPVLPGPADAPQQRPATVAPVPEAAEQVAAAIAVREDHAAGEDDAADPVDPSVPPADTVPAPRPPRAGRNLWLAFGVGLVLGVGSLAAAWWHPLALAALVYGFCIAAIVEWRSALARIGLRVPLVPVIAVTVGMAIATWFARAEGLVVAVIVAAAGIVAWRIVDERVENTLADSLAGIFTVAWIPFLGSFVMLLEMAEDGWLRVFMVLVAVVLNDTGALFTGMLMGRRKLAPRVSPKKTWEGAIGGAVLGTAGAAALAYVAFDGRWWIGAAVGAACVVAAVLGDLAESALKRDIAIKDMSSAIPGHGGILDRLDSILPAAAAAYVVFALLMGTS